MTYACRPCVLALVPCNEKLDAHYKVKNTFIELITPTARARSTSAPPDLATATLLEKELTPQLTRANLAWSSRAGSSRTRRPSVDSQDSDLSTPDFNANPNLAGPFDKGGSRASDARSAASCDSFATADLNFADTPKRQRGVEHTFVKLTPLGAVTTLMVRNLPIRTTVRKIFDHLDEYGFTGLYDFVHFPVDMRTRMHTGYAFVNFVDQRTAIRVMEVLHGTQLQGSTSRKIISVCRAARQGVSANLAALEKSCGALKLGWSRAGKSQKPPELPWVRSNGGAMKQLHNW